MGMCPLCNGFQQLEKKCPQCSGDMVEEGRVIDYFDDYSAYMDIDLMKLVDGYENSYSEHKCAHLFKCSHCGSDEVVLIDE